MNSHRLCGLIVLAFTLGLVSERAYAQTTSNITYTVTDLGSLRTDGTGTSDGHEIDSEGVVVGVADGNDGFQHAFIWQAATGIKNLELFGNGQFTIGGNNSAAYGVSYKSAIGNSIPVRFIVGEANPPALATGSEHALVLDAAGLVDINGTGAFNGGPNSAAAKVNTNGVTVGWAVLANNTAYHAFRYTNASMVDLGTLPGGNLSVAVALNNFDDVVGWSDNSNGVSSAVVWRHAGGGATKIPGLTVANGVNDAGLAVGGNVTGLNTVQAGAFNLQTAQTVALAAQAGQSSMAWGLNNHGQIVGASGSGAVILGPGITTDVVATLWEGSNMVDLNSRITDTSWHLSTAEAINDAGQIVGAGFHNGTKRGFLLTPPPSISSPNVMPRELLPAGGPVTISAVVSNNPAAGPVSANISGAGASILPLIAEPNNYYTDTFNVPGNATSNAQTYTVNIQAGSVLASAGTFTVDGISPGILKVSSTNLVFKATAVGKKATLTVKLQNTGPLHSAPLRLKINGPFTSFGLIAFKVKLPASAHSTIADGSTWLNLAPGKSVIVTVTFQPAVSMLPVVDQISIGTNGSGQPPVTVQLSGTGK